MGMVQACPGRGTQVKEFSMDFLFQNVLFFHVGGQDKPVREMFGIRRMLELGYMRQAFYALKEEDIRHIRQCADEIRTRWDAGEIFTEADYEFHMSLFRPLNNSVLNSLLESIWAVDAGFELEEKMPHLSSSINKHDAIVQALENYDFLAFAKAMEEGRLFTAEPKRPWMCLNCGYILEAAQVPQNCPVCRHPQGYFIPTELAPWSSPRLP